MCVRVRVRGGVVCVYVYVCYYVDCFLFKQTQTDRNPEPKLSTSVLSCISCYL